MSIMLADIDATCASLGYYDGKTYLSEPDALQGLKVILIRFKIVSMAFNPKMFSIVRLLSI